MSYGDGIVKDNAKAFHNSKIFSEFGENAKAFHRSICRVEYCGGNTVLLRDAELVGAYCRVTGDSVYYGTEHAAGEKNYRSDKKIENKKFQLTNNWKVSKNGRKVYQIEAIKDFGDVKAGELGGWVEHEFNLSHFGSCWINTETVIEDHSHVCGKGQVCNTTVSHGSVVKNDDTIENTIIENSILEIGELKTYFTNNKIKNSKIHGGLKDSYILNSFVGTDAKVDGSTVIGCEIFNCEINKSTIKNSKITSKLDLEYKAGYYAEIWGKLVINLCKINNANINENGSMWEVSTSTFSNYPNVFKYPMQIYDKDICINNITLPKSTWRSRAEHGKFLFAQGEHELMHWFRENEHLLEQFIPHFFKNTETKNTSGFDVFNEKKEHKNRISAIAEIVKE